jgi:hypothetical protein
MDGLGWVWVNILRHLGMYSTILYITDSDHNVLRRGLADVAIPENLGRRPKGEEALSLVSE